MKPNRETQETLQAYSAGRISWAYAYTLLRHAGVPVGEIEAVINEHDVVRQVPSTS